MNFVGNTSILYCLSLVEIVSLKCCARSMFCSMLILLCLYTYTYRLCLGAWMDHGERTGGFYACNRYEVAKQEGQVRPRVLRSLVVTFSHLR